MVKERQSNIELLRIIAMFCLIGHHMALHGGFREYCSGINLYFAALFVPLGKIALICFVAISSWFLGNAKFKFDRFLKVWLEVMFYNFIVTMIAYYLQGDNGDVGAGQIIGTFFPILGNAHGFASTYLFFYLLTPFLRIIKDHLNRNQNIYLIVILLIVTSCSSIISYFTDFKQSNNSVILLFCTIFFICNYLRNYCLPTKNSKQVKKISFVISLVCIIFKYGISFVIRLKLYPLIMTPFIEVMDIITGNEYGIVNIISGISIVVFFSTINIPNNRVINYLATSTLAIILIHDNHYLRFMFWEKFVNTRVWMNFSFPIFLLIYLAVIICIFLISYLTEFIRKQIEKPIMGNKGVISLCKRMDSLVNQQVL